jgi:hypothetical protein
MKSIATKQLKVNLIREYSAVSHIDELGEFDCTFELFCTSPGNYFVEWDIPEANEYVEIGIFCYGEDKVLSDYDGVFSLSSEVITFLEENGFNCEYAK